jgi:ubiquinone/menaquinone biosynthesis C-methylase UbiE
MSPRYDAEWVANLLDAERRLGSISPDELLLRSGLSDGMTVVDYGCGPGFFTLPAANVVGPQDLVYAVDIEPRMVALVADRAAKSGHQNVRAVLNEAGTAPLPDAIAHFAICALVMHYREGHDGRVALARDLGRLVTLGGRVLLIQWKPDPDEGTTHRASFEQISAVMAEVGFDCDAPQPLVEGQYMLTATKRLRSAGDKTGAS